MARGAWLGLGSGRSLTWLGAKSLSEKISLLKGNIPVKEKPPRILFGDAISRHAILTIPGIS